MEQVFKLTDLQKRKEPKRQKDFFYKIQQEEKEPNQVDIESEIVEVELQPRKVIFTDKRTTLVDRELILNRLKRPVQSLLITQSLLPTDEPQTKRFLTEKENDVVLSDEADDSIANDRIGEALVEKEQQEPEDADADAIIDLQDIEEAAPKTKKPRGKRTKAQIALDADKRGEVFDFTIEKVGKTSVAERVPKTQKFTVGVSEYYMNNRKIYISHLAKVFKKYSDKIAEKSAELTCKTLQSNAVDFDLLTHQLVIRDYLNLYTPYRGLLLFHGLGSGKTCTSIGVAEGMKTDKNIVLMTPASLKMNFFSELKKCGDVLYKKNQFWEFVSIEGDMKMVRLLSQVLGLEPEFIRKQGGAWLMNIKKRSNFSALSDNDQKSVDQQIDAMIRNKYMDINYNGLRNEHLDELTNGGKVNPFDNKVVIVDEAHNLVSRIANTGSKKGSIAYRLYHALMDATNAKVIFLSGTPIINTPREIGILFNMLRGYIKTWTFQLETTTSGKINTEIIMDYLRDDGFITYDYVDYSTNKLVITRNPFGFINTYKKGTKGKKSGGSKRKHTNRNDKKPTMRTTKKNTVIDTTDEIYDDDENKEIAHMYDEVGKTPYEGGGAYDEYSGVRYDEMGNISDYTFESRIVRILKDHDIRVVGKPKIKKELCLPDDDDLFAEMFINNEKGELVNKDLLKRRILGLTSYFRSAQEQLLPSFVKSDSGANYHTVYVDMSDYQFEVYESVRKEERDEEEKKRKRVKKGKPGTEEVDEKQTSTYRIYSRSACNFAFPADHPRPYLAIAKGAGKENAAFNKFNAITQEIATKQDDFFEEEKEVDEEDAEVTTYQERIKETYEFLEYNPRRERAKEYLRERDLGLYSPKYLTILRTIKNEENIGLHLLYSQFRTLEGIGIFKLILEANGFVEFKIAKKGQEWEIENFDIDPEKPRFVLYTGTETAEEKEIIRNIYNGTWHLVPPSIVEVIKTRHSNNLYGEIIKVLMITASGAEGINLRNTRFVHIMEPYWNMVRIDQVVGRARRICSHEDLPPDMRNVQVFIYLCQATPEQIDKNIELRTKDLSKMAYKIHDAKLGRDKTERVPFTTDQYLFEIAQIKDSITRQILTSVKETAIDCSLYNNNPDEPLVCYGFGKTEPQSFASYPILERDAQEKPQQGKKETTKLGAVTYDGIKYAVDKSTFVVYDFNSYLKAKEKRGELLEVGKYDMRTKTIIFEKA
jgi:hypothetical protein